MIEPAPFFAEVASAPGGARALWLETSDGVRLRMVAWGGGGRGTAYIFPGRTEYAEKYGLVAQALVERGYSVVVIDWRGQGLSDRRGRTPLEGHVDDFREFQTDVRAVLAAAADLDLREPFYIFAHSMGGCIALRTLIERRDIAGAVLSAPMWRLQARTAWREVQSKTLRLLNRFGAHQRVSPVSSTAPDEASPVFEGNALTGDAGMFAWSQAQVAAHPGLALGPPGAAWSRAAILEMLRLDFLPLPALPVLALAGSEERIVSNAKVRARAARLPRGRYLELAGARHELFLETADIRARLWREIDAFLAGIEADQAA
jgi:lysophospholipase